jgi:hypothetical protein
MDLGFLLDQVKRAIYDDPSTPQREGHDPSGLIGNLEGLFGNFGRQFGYGNNPQQGQVLPASQDPYGDPADMGRASYPYVEGGNLPQGVRPASQDPLGDPADRFPNVRPASEDPLGDPADQ